MTMSPAGHTFRQRCRMNPSLISCCTIDWYDEWSEEAMLVVANVYLPRTLFTLEPTKSPDVSIIFMYSRAVDEENAVEMCCAVDMMIIVSLCL